VTYRLLRFVLLFPIVLDTSGLAVCLESPIGQVTLITGTRETAMEHHYAEVLAERLNPGIQIQVSVISEDQESKTNSAGLRIYLGNAVRHNRLKTLCKEQNILAPNVDDPGEEGFVLKSWQSTEGPCLLAAGTDERGVLYAAGEILRQVKFHETGLEIDTGISIHTAPAFRVRGLEVFQHNVVSELTKVRPWTEQEWQQVVLDFALAGANTISQGDWKFVDAQGLNIMGGISPSLGSGPAEWCAVEPLGRKTHLCPSIPEARKSILDSFRTFAQSMPPYDYLRIYSADGGGCLCEKCAPYGKTFIHMAEEIAGILHAKRPEIQFMVTNQELDNAGDQAIFDYLNEKPRDWLYAFCYAPGSNAMAWTSARRADHRMDLYRHPAMGPLDRYLREILHNLPPQQTLIFFTDVTHWLRSQYGLVLNPVPPDRNGRLPPREFERDYMQHPDASLAKVFNRRSFFARPRHYHHVFTETMRYGDGDVVYSEGHHDHVNRWLWMRLLWDPHRSVESIIEEYCNLWFGPEAAPQMAQAIFQLEENHSTPLATNDGIERYVEMVYAAGAMMPEWRMKRDYLWHMYWEKGLLDYYVQLRLLRQMDSERRVLSALQEGLQKGNVEDAVTQALTVLDEDKETNEMRAIRESAIQIGEEGDRRFGVRNEGFLNLDTDLVGLGWYSKQLQQAKLSNPNTKAKRIREAAYYSDPGPGGFYDNLGEWDSGLAPHLVKGWSYSPSHSPAALSFSNHPSQNTMAFTLEEEEGITLEFTDLDPAALYTIRFSLVRPEFLPRYADYQPQKTESIYADEVSLVKDLELPLREAEFFEYEIPHEVTSDGQLKVVFRKGAGVGELPAPQLQVWKNTDGWGTLCSEVWLSKTSE
jgi:hypothetical protein